MQKQQAAKHGESSVVGTEREHTTQQLWQMCRQQTCGYLQVMASQQQPNRMMCPDSLSKQVMGGRSM
jgi:hypothetical protein